MEIGEVIRKYRKEKNFTQEEMADRLGVTAPAVNKWERGVSYPDITLLAPIARLLGVSLDTLLAFQKDISEEQINEMIKELDARLGSESYADVFKWAKERLEIYTNSETLALRLAQVLEARRIVDGMPREQQYEDFFLWCYERALASGDERTKNGAAESLYYFYFRQEQYEKAEAYLQYFADGHPEKQRMQAEIYSKTGKTEAAYKAYEELLFSGYNRMSLVLNSMYCLAMKEGNKQKAYLLLAKSCELAAALDMGEYRQNAPWIDWAVAEQDVDLTVDITARLLNSLGSLFDFIKSPLYEHMAFRQPATDYMETLKVGLLENFRSGEGWDFVKDDPRWQELLEQYTNETEI